MNKNIITGILLMILFACHKSEFKDDYTVDGRQPINKLYSRYEILMNNDKWVREIVYSYPDSVTEILSYKTKKEGPALWIISGIHGEEPAGPNAIANNIERISELAESNIPVVLLPLCNPRGYRNGWRYPNTAERDWRKGGYSVGDSEYLLPDLENGNSPRSSSVVGPETAALTAHVLKVAITHSPKLVLDFHEDELSIEGGYIYSQGNVPDSNPVSAEIIKILQSTQIPLRLNGFTRFSEPIINGVISSDDKGLPLRDGSIDELLASTEIFINGEKQIGPSAPTVIVVETPAFKDSNISLRISAHEAIINALPILWALSLDLLLIFSIFSI